MKKIIPALFAVLILTGCSYAVETSNENLTDTANFSPLEERIERIAKEAPSLDEKEIANMEEINKEIHDLIQSTETLLEEYAILYDVQLRSNQREILIGQNDHEIIWYAEIPVDYQPDSVNLVDADTGEVVAELLDEADFEKYGDTIKGDSVYNCRFSVNTDIDTDPEVSEDVYYHYYAEFMINNIRHRSETVDIWVVEPFTDKELDDMEEVDNAVDKLMESEDYQHSSDEEKRVLMISLLEELSTQGTPERPYSLIMPDSILDDEDTVSFQYICGISSVIMIKDLDPRMN